MCACVFVHSDLIEVGGYLNLPKKKERNISRVGAEKKSNGICLNLPLPIFSAPNMSNLRFLV